MAHAAQMMIVSSMVPRPWSLGWTKLSWEPGSPFLLLQFPVSGDGKLSLLSEAQQNK